MIKLILVTILMNAVSSDTNTSLHVTINQGTLQGHKLKSRSGRDILAFQGIPYVKPPLGEFRFQSPQAPEKWDGVLDATKPVPLCTQRNLYQKMKLMGQEDCLYINVYTPHIEGHRLLDVMVYIHGGGFFSGEGIMHEPTFLLDKDVVLVNFNYRLGPLGFLSTGDSVCPGNNGLKDQVAALRWVRENIAAFGGNPGSVTIFGESAGGASVHYLVLSPMSQGLFHRAISQSATVLCPWAFSYGNGAQEVDRLASTFNCPTQPSSEFISCLRTREALEITDVSQVSANASSNRMSFLPVLESGPEAFLPAKPIDLIKNHRNSIPWITGITSEEGAIFGARLYGTDSIPEFDKNFKKLAPELLMYKDLNDKENDITEKIRKFYFKDGPISTDNVTDVLNMFTDSIFLYAAHQAVKLHSAIGDAPVFYYYFSYKGAVSHSSMFGDNTRDYGVSHADDLLYLFPLHQILPNSEWSEKDDKMVDIMTSLWTSFAHTGKPTFSPNEEWNPVSTPNKAEYLHIDSRGLKLKQGLLLERATFWESLPIYLNESEDKRDEL